MDRKPNRKRDSDAELMKDGHSRRVRAGQAGRGKSIPRVMILAGVLIVAGAAWLYWPAGDSAPTGLGERQTVVTQLPDGAAPTGQTGPSSGDVDIDQQTTPLTPEKSEDGQAVDTTSEENPSGTPGETVAAPVNKAKATPEPVIQEAVAQKPAPKPAPPAARIEPSASGSYAVQTGSFGNAVNADKEAARLKTLGWDTSIRAGNNSSGQMVFRVWITHFKSRQDAQTFINQNAKQIPGSIPVHR